MWNLLKKRDEECWKLQDLLKNPQRCFLKP